MSECTGCVSVYRKGPQKAEGSTKVVLRKSGNSVMGNEREGEGADISVTWRQGCKFSKMGLEK